MIKALCFSKGRPLQLQGYLNSLLCMTGIEPENVAVIYYDDDDYKALKKQRPTIEWIAEQEHGGFDLALREYADRNKDNCILFGCDDCVYIRPCSLKLAESILTKIPTFIGFSFRLGLNIRGLPQKQSFGAVFDWHWPSSVHHYNYCFELMGSMYRGSLLCEILEWKKQIPTPNYLESYGVQYCHQFKVDKQPNMCMFNTSNYLHAYDVNRIQNDFQNKTNGTSEHDPEVLKDLFRQGKRLDWEASFNTVDNECFVGDKYWKVK